MEEKLRKLMKQEGINSTRLAEILGIQASGISHIMSGRNKPSYDFLLKLLQRFPQINPDWLLLGKGPMYRQEIKSGTGGAGGNAPVASPNSSVQRTFFEPDNNDIIPTARREGVHIAGIESPTSHSKGSATHMPMHMPTGEQPSQQHTDNFTRTSSIERIVVFFKDKTFSEYRPE